MSRAGVREIVLGARYVFPVEGPPIEGGRVTLRGGRIAAVSSRRDRSADLELGNVAVTPGFVNAHTHLELSPIEPAGEPEDEIAWLTRVISQRVGSGPEALARVVERNLAEALRSGTTLLADTTTAGLSWTAIGLAPVRATVFAEVLGLKRMRGLQTSQEAWDWVALADPEKLGRTEGDLRPGISPHAPYSTAGWLYHRAAQSGLPLSTHLAEMPEERLLLRSGSGRLRQFLEELGAWDEGWEPVGPSPLDYVRQESLRDADWIIAHGNDLEPSEFWQLRPTSAPPGRRLSVAFCPRTHHRFGHPPHPFREMLAAGVIVCLGTDSLASSPSLNILDEMRFLYASDPSLRGQLLLTMATLFGAWAMKAEDRTGSLVPGKSADLAIIGLPDREESDPHRLLLESDDQVVGTCYQGVIHTGPNDWKEQTQAAMEG